MNPIEKAFSKLKAFLRKIAERTVTGLAEWPGRCALWRSLGFFEFLGDRKSHGTPGRRRVDSNRRRSQRPRPCDPRSPLTRLRRFLPAGPAWLASWFS